MFCFGTDSIPTHCGHCGSIWLICLSSVSFHCDVILWCVVCMAFTMYNCVIHNMPSFCTVAVFVQRMKTESTYWMMATSTTKWMDFTRTTRMRTVFRWQRRLAKLNSAHLRWRSARWRCLNADWNCNISRHNSNNSNTKICRPRSTQPSLPPGSVNEYQLWLGRQRLYGSFH